MPSDRKQWSRRRVLHWLGAAGVVGAGAADAAPASAASLKIGQPAPAATLTTFDGEQLSTHDLIGKVVILTFWATWCVPCREELPLLSAYAQQHAAQGLSVLGFSLDDAGNLQQAREIGRKLAFPTGLLGGDRLGGYGRIWRIPVNFTVNRSGLLVDNGWDDRQPVWTRERLEQIVTPLLASSLKS